MSIYSPTIAPTSGRALASALGQGVNAYLLARRVKHEDEQDALNNDMSLYSHGLREQTPSEAQAVPTAGTVNQHLAASLNPQMGMNAPAQPVGYRPEDAPVHLGGRSFVMTDQAKHEMERNQTLDALKLLGLRGDMDLKKSEVAKNNSVTEKNLRAPLPTAQGHVVDPVTGEVKFFDPTHPPTSLSVHPAPANNVFVTGVGADGKPTVFAGKNRGAPALTDTGVSKPEGGQSGSASLSADDRQKMLNQARLDNATMRRIEARVLRGELNFGTAAGLAGAASQAHGSATHEMLGVLGNAAAGAIDPDIQNYFTAQASYGRIMGNLQSKRYTDHQADIERRISGMQGNDLKNTIDYKQQLRDASLADTEGTPRLAPRTSAPTRSASRGDVDLRQPAAPAASPTASPLRAKYEAAVRHLRETGRAAEIPNLPVPPEE